MNKGVLTVVSGFSGSGKGTIMKALLKKYDNYALSISATTRSPREGERNGREYFFKTKEEFQRLIEEDQLIEYAQYVENYYGTPREYVERCLDDGKDVILEIEVQGARKVKEKIPEAVLIFVTPPSAEELRARLVGRGTESMEVIESRLSRANEEAVVMPDYDYLLVNDDLEQCVEAMHGIIQAERCKMRRNETFQRNIKEELKELLKGEEV
ncbi:guanylate kinase [Blautia hydrogenotrophica]|uniref:guanylate kinase n=1 Tax=Blautia hydrogenotrophica TaxID=53443 RepID=UPI003A86BB01